MFKRVHPADNLHAVRQDIAILQNKERELMAYLNDHPDDCHGEAYTAAVLWGQVYLSPVPDTQSVKPAPKSAEPALEPVEPAVIKSELVLPMSGTTIISVVED
jgi:hypothetical protein